jgi:hypothetical protein
VFQATANSSSATPRGGTRLDTTWYTVEFKAALHRGDPRLCAAVPRRRHASLTNGAAAGEQPIALMARAGHRSMSTTKQYLHLAGVVFRDERRRSSGGSASRSR